MLTYGCSRMAWPTFSNRQTAHERRCPQKGQSSAAFSWMHSSQGTETISPLAILTNGITRPPLAGKGTAAELRHNWTGRIPRQAGGPGAHRKGRGSAARKSHSEGRRRPPNGRPDDPCCTLDNASYTPPFRAARRYLE